MKKSTEMVQGEILPSELLSFVEDIGSELREPRSLEEIARVVEERLGSSVDMELLALALARSPTYAVTPSHRYITRESLFNGARFRIEPTAEEHELGILIPGHRFLPLWWGPNAEEIVAEDADGEPISCTGLDLSFSRAFPYHYLLGYNWIPEFVRGNAQSDLAETRTFQVFDLARFLAKYDCARGDFIILEIRDAWEKRIVMHYESRKDALRSVPEIRSADVALEKSFLRVIEEPYILWSIPEQLFQALANVPPTVRTEPGSPFERFLSQTSSFGLQEVGLEMAAFPRDTSPFQLAMRRSVQEENQPDLFADPLDQLLSRLGINLQSGSIHGLLRLGAAENRSFAEVMGEIIPWDRLSRSNVADVRRFRSHLKKAWRKAVKEQKRTPLSPEMTALLGRAAALKEHVLKILRQLDLLGFKAEELPSRPLLRMVEIDELSECILQLNVEEEQSSFKRIGELEELLADVERHLDRLQDEILKEAFV